MRTSPNYIHVTKSELFRLLSEAKQAQASNKDISIDAQTMTCIINEILENRRNNEVKTNTISNLK